MNPISKGSPHYDTAFKTAGKPVEASGAAAVAKSGAFASHQLTPLPVPPSLPQGGITSSQRQSFAARATANHVKAAQFGVKAAEKTFWSKALDAESATSAREAVAAIALSADDM